MRLPRLGLLDLAGYLTIAAVGIVSFLAINDSTVRWAALGLILGFAALMTYRNHIGMPPHAYFAAQTLLAIGLVLLEPQMFAAGILFFILSADAMTTFPLRTAVAWIGGFAFITLITLVYGFGLTGVVMTLPYLGGYSFFGAFGNALNTARAERERSQQLLTELQAAQSQLQELAVAEERNRLARELHDSLGHRLTVAVVQLEGAQRLIPSDPERAARMVGTMRENMKEALGDLRQTVATLRAPLVDDLPLMESLTRLTQNFQQGVGLQVHLELPGQLPALGEPQRLAFYRAAQEALTNAQRHANAQNVWIQLRAEARHITLTARDDGIGYPTELNGGGFGLKGLRERTAQLGGELHLNNISPTGAELQMRLPLANHGDTERTEI